MTTPPTTDDTNVRVNEIHDRLDVLAPYPSTGDATAKGLARYLAKQAQVSWSRGMNGPATLSPAEVARMVSEYAAAHALTALEDASPAFADVIATQIHDAWEDGGSIGEWIWELLGSDAEKIAGLARELAEVKS